MLLSSRYANNMPTSEQIPNHTMSTKLLNRAGNSLESNTVKICQKLRNPTGRASPTGCRLSQRMSDRTAVMIAGIHTNTTWKNTGIPMANFNHTRSLKLSC